MRVRRIVDIARGVVGELPAFERRRPDPEPGDGADERCIDAIRTANPQAGRRQVRQACRKLTDDGAIDHHADRIAEVGQGDVMHATVAEVERHGIHVVAGLQAEAVAIAGDREKQSPLRRIA